MRSHADGSQQNRFIQMRAKVAVLCLGISAVALIASASRVRAQEKFPLALDKAQSLLDEGRASDAVTLLEAYTRKDPKDAQGYILLGRAYALTSQLDKAADNLRLGLALSPHSVAAYLNLGVVEVMQGNKEGGEKEFQRALEIDPNQREALYNLGRLAFDEKDSVSAFRYFTKCVALLPSDRDALTYLLRSAIANNNTAQVAEIHKRLRGLLPPEGEAHLEIAQWLAEGKLYADAEEEFETALAFSPDSPNVRYSYATLCLNRGLVQKALELLGPLSSSEDETARYHYLLGQCYERSHNAQRALLEYKRAIEIDPDQEIHYISLATLLASHQEGDAAEDILAQATRRFPRSVRIFVGMGLVQLQTGNVENAKAAYQQAVGLDTHSPLCLDLLGRIQMAQGHYDEAIKAFQDAVRLAPSDTQGYFFMGLGYTKLPDKSDEALRAFLHALSLNRDLADTYYWIGSVYFYRKEKYPEAAKYLEEALKRAPQWGAAYQLLIQSYRMMGDEAKAADAAQRFRKIGRLEGPQLDLSVLLNNR